MTTLSETSYDDTPVALLLNDYCYSDPEIALALSDLLLRDNAVSVTITCTPPNVHAGRNQIDPAVLDKFILVSTPPT